ncbi:MAG: thiol:disulfide interchange protein DsbA/DsbL [Azoarcus sp.]|jgi:thiol:disulfide interchange protein DsbA|nr:thiol:disulfide interchange protein DsbA/DsbL [Azoarcus sp.]
MNRRDAIRQLGALALLAAPASFALAQKSDRFHTLDPVVPTDVEGKIEVIEFFHYACPHCREFDPVVTPWARALPADVAFTQTPVIWGTPPLRKLAQIYYALKAAKQLDALHAKMFAAAQAPRGQQVNFADESVLRDWIGKQGVDAKVFMDAYKSFGVQAQVRRAEQIDKSYKIDGVPMMAVGGRFVTSGSLTGGHQAMLKEVDSLIERVRRG